MVERIVLRKVKNSEELVLDMVSTPDFILKSVDWGTIKSSHRTYKYVNQIGVTVTGTTLETRSVVIEGWVVAQNETHMTVLKRTLNRFINPQEAIDLFYDDYTIRFVSDETVRYSINAAENNEIMCKFQINGTCPNPLFSNNAENRLTFATTVAKFHFPLVLPEVPHGGIIFGERTDSLIVSVINNGDVSVGMRIVFKANGSVLNPKLINIKTQEVFAINKNMAADEEIEINTNIGEKGVKGKIGNAPFANYFMYKDIDSDWLQLDIGENIFRYAADSGLDNLEVYVYFYNKFLEVQACY